MLDTLTRRLSDYLIYVVEDYTSVDQRAVHRHSRALQARRKCPGSAQEGPHSPC